MPTLAPFSIKLPVRLVFRVEHERTVSGYIKALSALIRSQPAVDSKSVTAETPFRLGFGFPFRALTGARRRHHDPVLPQVLIRSLSDAPRDALALRIITPTRRGPGASAPAADLRLASAPAERLA